MKHWRFFPILVKIEVLRHMDLSDSYALIHNAGTAKLRPRYSEMYKKIIGFCDPSFIESIEIESLNSQEIYEDILKTQQWRNSQKIILNRYFDGSLKVNLNDFLHFKSFSLNVEELSVDDAWKLVQKFVSNESPDDFLDIRSQKPLQADLIRQKTESELVGDWKRMAHTGARFLVYPKSPQLILQCNWEENEFNVAFITPETFNVYRPFLLD